METFQILLRLRDIRNREGAEDALRSYVAALSQNGQVLGDTSIARVRGGYQVLASVPRADALDKRSANPWGRRAVERLVAAGFRPPKFRRLGPELDSLNPCSCRRRSFFILFANFLTDESPVRCGRCFGPVPLYTLPATEQAGNFRDVVGWQSTYQAMDWLFIGSGAGEHYSHRQMSDWNSALSKEGRGVAANLEAKTGRPVYYYLMKHYGVNDARERQRKCPSCKGRWALAKPLHRIFDFRCDRCRLVSNVAFDIRMGTT